MNYLRKKVTTLVAVGALALGSLALTPRAQADVCVDVTSCATGCLLGVCVTVCVTVTVCVSVEQLAS